MIIFTSILRPANAKIMLINKTKRPVLLKVVYIRANAKATSLGMDAQFSYVCVYIDIDIRSDINEP